MRRKVKPARRKVEPDILQAAIKLFGLYSFNGVTTRMLAKEARVNEPAIYLHFKSKENLYEQAINEVVEQTHKEFETFVLKIFHEDPTPSMISEALQGWYQGISEPAARLLLQVFISDPKRAKAARSPLDEIVDALAKTLERQKQANHKFNPHLAAKVLIQTFLWAKAMENNTTRDMERALQQWQLGLPPA